MNHKPHVRFVDPHPECVRRSDSAQLTCDKALLDSLFLLGWQTCMEVARFNTLFLQKPGYTFGVNPS